MSGAASAGWAVHGVQTPGWHVQIPLVDTVIIVKVNERLGSWIGGGDDLGRRDDGRLAAVHLSRADPARFALELDNPERIVF
jgi:hypothetical protein